MRRLLPLFLYLAPISSWAQFQILPETPEEVYQNCMREPNGTDSVCRCVSQTAQKMKFDTSKMYVLEMSPGVGNGDIQQPTSAEQQKAIDKYHQIEARCQFQSQKSFNNGKAIKRSTATAGQLGTAGSSGKSGSGSL
jgi:hypothetical protein